MPDAAELRRAFDAAVPLTIGVEEELMVLDADTLDLAPRAPELLERLGGDPRFKLELPAAQIEIATPPEQSVQRAGEQLMRARVELAVAAEPDLRIAAAGAHPFAAPVGALNRAERYDFTRAEYGEIAERQLVFGLHVHVGIGDADRALAVHDALRSYLPQIAALAANAPFHEGRDSGLASVRPRISGLLPRQGVPPALWDFDAYAEQLAWGTRAGVLPSPRHWWWELRLHPSFGTVEVRVADAQTTVAETVAIAGLVHALVAWLDGRAAAGETLAVAPRWRIEENRWSACRWGLAGELADLETGEREPTARALARLIAELRPAAERIGAASSLDAAHELLRRGGGAVAQRRVAAERGLAGLAGWLAERYDAD